MKTIEIEDPKVTYSASGLVYGKYWGGGEGGYEARKFEADTLEELIEKVNKALEDGSLDSGMGYESLIGALMDVATTTVINIDGKAFVNTSSQLHTFGDLTDEQREFLEETYL